MIRRITSLALGLAFTFSAAGAMAQEEGGEKAEGGEEAKPAEGEGEAKAGGEASASAAVTEMPESKGAFGKSGQIAISSDFSLGFHITQIKPPQGDTGSQTTMSIAPALDYFVADSISIGAQLSYTSVKLDKKAGGNDETASTISVGPRVGYNLGLSDNISFWPKLGFYYTMAKPAVKDAKSNNRMGIGVNAPILFHPAQHFFIGLGPDFSMDISSKTDGQDSAKLTVFGVGSVVGGWF